MIKKLFITWSNYLKKYRFDLINMENIPMKSLKDQLTMYKRASLFIKKPNNYSPLKRQNTYYIYVLEY